MTTPIEETYVVVDADLDTADSEDVDHSFHRACQGGDEGPKISRCGEMAVFIYPPLTGPPHNACQECLPLWFTKSCRACGA